MAQYINTNIASLGAQRQLSKSNAAFQKSIERLSSNLRINSAKDDAAGFAISERMTAQINGQNQAIKNATYAGNLAGTASGGLSEISGLLQRMRDLAVDAANDTNSDADREALQNEMKSLYDEIDRISTTTEYNGKKLFSGTSANNALSFQVGANSSQTLSLTIGEVNTKTLALNSSVAVGQTYSGRIAASDDDAEVTLLEAYDEAAGETSADVDHMTINGISIDVEGDTDIVNPAGGGSNIEGLVDAINSQSSQTGVTVEAFNRVEGTRATISESNVVTGLQITVHDADGTAGTAVTVDDASSLSQLVDNINRQVGGVTASIGDDGNLVLSNDTGGSIEVGVDTDAGGDITSSGLTADNYSGYLAFTSSDGSDIEFGVSDGADASLLNSLGLNVSSGNGSVVTDGKITAAAADISTADTGALALLDDEAGVYDPEETSTDIVKINGVTIGATTSGSAADKAAAINAVSDETGVTATASTVAYVTVDATNIVDGNEFEVNGTTITLTVDGTADMNDVVDSINNAGISGVTAETDAETGKLVLRSESGQDIFVGDVSTDGVFTGVTDDPDADATEVTVTGQVVGVRGKVTLTAEDGGSIRITGDGTASGGTGLAKFGLVEQNSDDNVVGGELNLLTVESATAAIDAIDNALETLNTKAIEIGTFENRLSRSVSNLEVSKLKLSESRQAIQEADFAAETASLTRAQIMQQAGTAMLAQANQAPQGVLSLLQ